MASKNHADTHLNSDDQPNKLDEAIASLKFSFSSDSMVAYINPPDDVIQQYSFDTLKDALKHAGIAHGLVDDQILKEYLLASTIHAKPWVVAQGTAVHPPQEPQIEYLFDTAPLKVGELDEQGNIDFKRRGKIAMVKAGDVIARIVPGEAGKAGKNVYGLVIPPPKSKPVRMDCGKGVETSEDGLHVLATIDGRPSLDHRNKLSILEDYTIPGDVGYETGHIEFDGHVEVRGTIQDGFQVKGRTLKAAEINRADIQISDAITVTGGIIGATVKSDGSLAARHIHTATIEVRGDVVADTQIFDSKIETNGKCVVQNGKILTSRISAKKGIYAVDIGSESSQACVLTVGVDEFLKRDVAVVQEQIKGYTEELKAMSAELQKAGEAADQLESKIGELAQEEDRAKVQQHALKEKMKMLQGDSPGILQARQKAGELDVIIQKKIEMLGSQIENAFKEQERLEEDTRNLQEDIKEQNQRIQVLQDQIKRLQAVSQADTGLAIVRAQGVIYAGTIIQGPRTKLVLKENHRNATIREVRDPNAMSSNAMIMQIGHGGR